MAILRAVAVTALALLLLEPILRLIITDQKDPIVLSYVDVSESVRSEMDSVELLALSARIRSQVPSTVEVVAFDFAEQISETAEEAGRLSTDISSTLEQAYQQYANDNVAAIILATDGLYNRGQNPLYLSHAAGLPIYTIGLGDSTVRRDLSVKNVLHNQVAYKGDKMQVEVDVAGTNVSGQSAVLQVYKITDGKRDRVHRETISFTGEESFATRTVTLDLAESGVQQYRATISSVEGEITTANNFRDFFIRVIETRRRIALLAARPHPDLTALRQLLSSNQNYEIDLIYASDYRSIKDYDVAIAHQIPSGAAGEKRIMDDLVSSSIPTMWIVGANTITQQLNAQQTLVTIAGGNRQSTDVNGRMDPAFQLYEPDDSWPNLLKKYPPLQAPFGKSSVGVDGRVYLYQKIGSVDTEYPLVTYGESKGRRMMVLGAEGIWRWRLYNYLETKTWDQVENFLEKSIQYLSTKEDKRQFRSSLPQYVYDETEEITLSAELYDDSYDPINDPEVSIVLRNADNDTYTYTMERSGRFYQLDIASLAPGTYRYSASTTYQGEELRDGGRFVVRELQLEQLTRAADFHMLRDLSMETGGKFLPLSELDQLSNLWQEAQLKPTLYQSTQTRSLMDLRWIFFLLVLPLLIEWFLRRYHGSY